MKIEFDGMDELLAKVKAISTGREFEETNKYIVKQGLELAKNKMKSKMPTSKDNSKSGKKGNRPSGNAKNNILASKVTNKKGYFSGEVGWGTNAEDEYFYAKFINYGTTKMKPQPFVQDTYDEIEKPIEQMAIKEYENLLKKLGD